MLLILGGGEVNSSHEDLIFSTRNNRVEGDERFRREEDAREMKGERSGAASCRRKVLDKVVLEKRVEESMEGERG